MDLAVEADVEDGGLAGAVLEFEFVDGAGEGDAGFVVHVLSPWRGLSCIAWLGRVSLLLIFLLALGLFFLMGGECFVGCGFACRILGLEVLG